jgi:2-polyprenyl-3-methyl-5-hydroxy-6-metoxy-1,4-benzoquinol methylase
MTDTAVGRIPTSAMNPVQGCDLCGSGRADTILETDGLDGPLMKCSDCGLHFVAARPSDLTFGERSPQSTAERLKAANAQFRDLPRSEERRLNELNAEWRIDLIQREVPAGRLLEVGCGRGDFLRVAARHFDVSGVEPNPELAEDAAGAGPIHRGLVPDAPAGDAWADFDVVASFHVIEHVNSPREFVKAIGARLKPGGLLVLETPDIGSVPFRVFGSRWREFIPEHYYFFDRTTLGRLLEDNGFRIRQMTHVGKHASIGLMLNRLSRRIRFLRRACGIRLPGTVRINPGDILLALAVRES